MREIDAGYAKLFLYDEKIVVVETKPGVIVEGSMVKAALDLIEKQIAADYSVIINRKNEYKLMRLEIYNETNHRQRLIGIAIVTHSKAAEMLTDLEIPLSQKKIAKFSNLEDAISWAKLFEK